jgi:hypothetical protein
METELLFSVAGLVISTPLPILNSLCSMQERAMVDQGTGFGLSLLRKGPGYPKVLGSTAMGQ